MATILDSSGADAVFNPIWSVAWLGSTKAGSRESRTRTGRANPSVKTPDQFDWRYSQAGKYTEVARDALHRITSVTYPAVSPWPAITVATDYDEFGRVEQTTDASSTSTFTYDDLNRLKTAVPGTGQGVTYSYNKDLANKRWTTAVALAGVTGNWQFGEDSKCQQA